MNMPIQPIPISRSRQPSPRPPSPKQTDPQLARLDILGAFDPLAQSTEKSSLDGIESSATKDLDSSMDDDEFGGFVSVDNRGIASSFSDLSMSPSNDDGLPTLRRVSTSPSFPRRISISPTSPPRKLSSIMTSTSPPNPLSSTVHFSPSSPETFRPTPPNDDFFAAMEAQAPTTFKTSAFRFSPQQPSNQLPGNFFSSTISKSLKKRWQGSAESKDSRPAIPYSPPKKRSAPTLTTPTKEEDQEDWLSNEILSASQHETLNVPTPILSLRRAISQEYLPGVRLLDRNSDVEAIITTNIAEQLRVHLPAHQRLAKSWRLLYSLDQHGISLHTMYQKVFDQGPLLLAVRDADNGIFGAFVNESFHPYAYYYGNGECFLWKCTPHSLRAYKWTGQNDYMILSEIGFISVGGGDGKFGLWLDSDFDKGVTSRCPAFNNEVLSASGEHFECAGVEVWAFGGL